MLKSPRNTDKSGRIGPDSEGKNSFLEGISHGDEEPNPPSNGERESRMSLFINNLERTKRTFSEERYCS